MSTHFITANPSGLLTALKKAIDTGKIVTWSYDSAGDFTHTPSQWKNLAWFRPEIRSDRLVLSIIKPLGRNISSEVYAVYHGRFIESMLAHFDTLFTNGYATAKASDKDLVA